MGTIGLNSGPAPHLKCKTYHVFEVRRSIRGNTHVVYCLGEIIK